MRSALIGLLSLVVSGFVLAQGGDTLERIEAERQLLQAESQNAEAQCYARFAVNACLSDVSADRRARLAQLKKRELAVRDAQRAERTREQLERLDDKQREQEARLRELAERGPDPVPSPKESPQAAGVTPSSKEKVSSPITPAEASSNRSAYDSKVLEGARHKAEVEKKLLEQKDRADPLPATP